MSKLIKFTTKDGNNIAVNKRYIIDVGPSDDKSYTWILYKPSHFIEVVGSYNTIVDRINGDIK